MQEGYSSRSVYLCVCISVITLAATYLVNMFEYNVPLGFLCRFQDMNFVASVENTVFKSSGDTC